MDHSVQDLEASRQGSYYGTLDDDNNNPISQSHATVNVTHGDRTALASSSAPAAYDTADDDDGGTLGKRPGKLQSLREKKPDWWITRAVYVSVAVLVMAVLAAVIVILIIGSAPPDNRPLYSFDDFIGKKLTPRRFSMQWTQWTQRQHEVTGETGEDAFTFWKIGSSDSSGSVVETCSLVLHRVEDGSESELLSHEKRSELDIACHTPHEISDTLVIFKPKAVNVFRHSSKAKYVLFDTSTGTHRFVSPRSTPTNDVMQKLMHWCPDRSKKMLAYVENNNLFVHNLDKDLFDGFTDRAVTSDGDEDTIFNGSTDWLYEEEIFEGVKTFFWSSDCNYVAFLKLNGSRVPYYEYPTYRYSETDSPYLTINRVRIPAVGYGIPMPSVHIYDIAKDETYTMDLKNSDNEDMYIYDLMWQSPTTLAAIRVNRVQQQRDLLLTNVNDDPISENLLPSSVVQRMTTSTWFEYRRSLSFLSIENGRYFVDIMPNGDAKHHYNIALFDTRKPDDDKFSRWLVTGEYDVTDIINVYNEDSKEIYYVSTERSPTDRHIFAVNVESGARRNLTSLEQQAYYGISLSPSGKYAMMYYDGPEVPKSTLIKTAENPENDSSVTFEDNSVLEKDVAKYKLPKIELKTIKNRVGDDLNALIMYPPGFSKSIAYPVLMYQYSGPGSQLVNSGFRAMHHAFSLYIASQGFIVVITDGRGTGFRGEKFMTQTYLTLGKLETEDQIDVAKYLRSLPYVNSNKIALWGWSYGGYMTLNAITSAENDGVFRLGISVAPVTNWLYYDAGYTERYMSLPSLNEFNYFNTSVFSQLVDESKKCLDHIPVGKGRTDLLLVHGTGDDNVHPLNSYNLMTQLQNCGVQFSYMGYPDKDHSIQGAHTTPHLYKMISDKLFSM